MKLPNNRYTHLMNDSKIILPVIAFFLGCITILIINVDIGSPLPIILPLIGTFLGAKYAFHLQNNKERDNQRKIQETAGRTALFNESNIARRLDNYQKEVIEPVRYDPNSYLLINRQAYKKTPFP